MIKFFQFVSHDIWHMTETGLSRGKIILYRMVKTPVLVVRGFVSEGLTIKASALSFSLLFALVPIVALVLAIARGLGFGDLIERKLSGSGLGGVEVAPKILEFVQRYLETAQGGVFLGIGILFLLYSIYVFFQQVENSFNSIWQVKKSRSFARQFTTYFSILLFLPIVMVLTSGLTIYINEMVGGIEVFTGVVRVLLKILPLLLIWIVFALIFFIVPNTNVKFANALISGVISGTAFQAFQSLYIWGQVYLARYNVVYGSFAAIPLLLLWLQVTSHIILIGAEITYLIQNIRNFEYEVDTKNISPRYSDYIGLYIMYLVVKRFEAAGPPITVKEIVDDNHLPIRLVGRLLSKLVDAKLLVEVRSDVEEDRSYLPAIDINQLSVGTYISKLESYGSELFIRDITPQMEEFWNKNLILRGDIERVADEVLIRDIL